MTKRDYNPSKAHQDAVGEHPIEEAIGDRAKTKADLPKQIPQNPSEILDVPSPSEMLSLEELNRRTEARLLDPENRPMIPPIPALIPVSKPDPQPVTETSSEESPPQKVEGQWQWVCPVCSEIITGLSERDYWACRRLHKCEREFHPIGKPIPGAEKLPADFKVKHTYETGIAGIKPTEDTKDRSGYTKESWEETQKAIDEEDAIRAKKASPLPAEDKELVALKKYILEDGFVLSTVAFHIVSLCAEPLTTPSTTTWDFIDRALIPDMVLALLNQPGYLEGIWPSLKIVMGSNAGNFAWTAGIATTIAFFDVIKTLPLLKDLQNEEKS